MHVSMETTFLDSFPPMISRVFLLVSSIYSKRAIFLGPPAICRQFVCYLSDPDAPRFFCRPLSTCQDRPPHLSYPRFLRPLRGVFSACLPLMASLFFRAPPFFETFRSCTPPNPSPMVCSCSFPTPIPFHSPSYPVPFFWSITFSLRYSLIDRTAGFSRSRSGFLSISLRFLLLVIHFFFPSLPDHVQNLFPLF